MDSFCAIHRKFSYGFCAKNKRREKSRAGMAGLIAAQASESRKTAAKSGQKRRIWPETGEWRGANSDGVMGRIPGHTLRCSPFVARRHETNGFRARCPDEF
jgi:hypothetical protein